MAISAAIVSAAGVRADAELPMKCQAEQNSVDYLQIVRQTGDAADLPDALRFQRDTDQRSEIVGQLDNEHQAELPKLQEMKPNGSTTNFAAHRDALDRPNTADNTENIADQIPAPHRRNAGAAFVHLAQKAWTAAIYEKRNSERPSTQTASYLSAYPARPSNAAETEIPRRALGFSLNGKSYENPHRV